MVKKSQIESLVKEVLAEERRPNQSVSAVLAELAEGKNGTLNDSDRYGTWQIHINGESFLLTVTAGEVKYPDTRAKNIKTAIRRSLPSRVT